MNNQNEQFYPASAIYNDMDGVVMTMTPDGNIDTTDDGCTGVMNYTVYPPTGDLPRYTGNTCRLGSYISRIAAGTDRLQEFMATLYGKGGRQVDITFTGTPENANKAINAFIQNQPKNVKKYLGHLKRQDVQIINITGRLGVVGV